MNIFNWVQNYKVFHFEKAYFILITIKSVEWRAC